MLSIVQLGYPTLTQKALPVKDFKDPKVQELIDEMIYTLKKNPDTSVGLAANQVGELKRITVIRRLDLENKAEKPKSFTYEPLINPKIIFKSDKSNTYWEGCLSIKQGNLFGQVTRPNKVIVEYFDRKGNKKELTAKSFFSTLIQHELDHLNGVLFTKYIKDPSLLYTREELDRMGK